MSQDAAQATDPRTADVYDVLDELADMVEAARAMPMSDKCVVNRNEILDLLDAVREMLPVAVQEAEVLLADRVGVVEEGYREAERAVEQATREANSLLEEANQQARALLEQANHEATALVDRANQQAAEAVDEALRQQAHLVSAHGVTEAAMAQAEAIRAEVLGEAEQIRHEVDQYVEAKFADFEASLDKTLAAVQRGRDRIRERFGHVTLADQEG